MQLTEHFTLEEACRSQTAVRLCIPNAPPDNIIEHMKSAAVELEVLRNVLGFKPLIVDSWYRSPQLNKAVGGAANSAHTQGWAIDFVCPAFGSPKQICEVIADGGLAYDQLIFEGTWVHISYAPAMRRNVLTAHFSPSGVSYTAGIA